MLPCIHTYDSGNIRYPHRGSLDTCTHPCIRDDGEPNHRIGMGFSGEEFYCDACGWEKTKEELRRMGLPIK